MKIPSREILCELVVTTAKYRGYEISGEAVAGKIAARLKEIETPEPSRDAILDILEEEINLAFPRIKHSFGSILPNGSEGHEVS